YVAPEMLTGTSVDLRADIYSLGATVYHMLAGRPPFAGLGLTQILTRKINHESPALADDAPDVSPATAALVAEMMARDPERRIGSYTQLLQRIDNLKVELQQGGATMLPGATTLPGSVAGSAGTRQSTDRESTDTVPSLTSTKTLPMPAERAPVR